MLKKVRKLLYIIRNTSEDGVSVRRETIIAKKGKELARLNGRGFIMTMKKKDTMQSTMKITYRDDRLQIESELIRGR